MGRKAEKGATPAVRAAAAAGVGHRLHAYEHADGETDFGAEAVRAMAGLAGARPEQIFKTLLADLDGRLVVAVLPVPWRLDLKALAAAAGGKRATMADPARAERSSGYVVGGISPLGQRTALPTVLDASALEWPTICVSAGRRGLEIELAPADLARVTAAVVAEVGRD
ncbi:Cys-tRNA(Pro)/Cys-tRNA(Cys) deacylase [Kineococcus xinjiangensis]|uniref:Cys-tRNA(Pro)/Cys-tRNA(Cys) deacylase n=1 Tax=Kineococcus xinjiangensis TaxID=512762 RepID=A0A2S6IM35_9ACTN|nr:Cys-tRNA(Pro) deacylase [Kineococcus xinjiangensis]PPK95210.1 Cys-tRNA(Pro)/Cys-tRNA(Cys) deacylase [Kineococcus xinjiangensis]